MKEKVPFILLSCLMIVSIFVASFLQMYWAMWDFTERVSCVDVSSGMVEVILRYCILTLGVLIVVSLLYSLGKGKWVFPLHLYIEIGLLVLCWLFCDALLFGEFEACWSTYTSAEVWYYTLYNGGIPALVVGSGLFCIRKLFFK